MSEAEQRLQRHVRAMAAVNRQLQAQVDGSRTWTPSSEQGEADLLTSGATSSGGFLAGARRAGAANAWLEQLAIGVDGNKPFLVRLANGRTSLIEGGYRRDVKSGLLMAALERMLGRVHTVSDDEFDRWTDGVPVEVLEGPQGPPFLVVGGQRLPLRGLPVPYPITADQMLLFPMGPELNIAEANVSRAQFQRAMYGRYQIDRARSAIARRGFVGASRAAASRVSRRFRRRAGSRRVRPLLPSGLARRLRRVGRRVERTVD
jgi:hypothetical protein